MSSFHFTIGTNSKSLPWTVHSIQETYPNFMLRLILGKASMPVCRLADQHGRKAGLN